MDGEVAHEPALVCAPALTFHALTGLPRIGPGTDLAALLCRACEERDLVPQACDVIVLTSKVVSKAEDRYVDLSRVEPSERARELAASSGADPRMIEVVLWDCERISRVAPGALIVRHHGGHVSANAGVDQSNVRRGGGDGDGPWALRLPVDPDASAAALRARLEQHFGVRLGVIISDSFGRPFRLGSIGTAIGASGLAALYDQRGRSDLDGRKLEHTITATADQLAAAADLVCGQADEARPAVLVRGLYFAARQGDAANEGARSLCRDAAEDLYL